MEEEHVLNKYEASDLRDCAEKTVKDASRHKVVKVRCYGTVHRHGRRDEQEVKCYWESAKVIIEYDGNDPSGT